MRHIFHAERWLSEQGLLSLKYYTRGRPWSELAIGIVTLDIFYCWRLYVFANGVLTEVDTAEHSVSDFLNLSAVS